MLSTLSIKEVVKTLENKWFLYKPESDVGLLEKNFNHHFPKDYIYFLEQLGEGSYSFKDFMFNSWCSASIVEDNQEYMIAESLGKDFVAIGTDGGGICFCLDFRNKEETSLVCVGLGDLDVNEVRFLANTFTKALQMMLEEKITLEEIL